MLVEIRAAHEKGKKTFGLDVFEGKATDMKAAGVVEPLRVKTQAISSAAEAAIMILRIDDVIASSKSPGPDPVPVVCPGHGRYGWHGWYGRLLSHPLPFRIPAFFKFTDALFEFFQGLYAILSAARRSRGFLNLHGVVSCAKTPGTV